MTNQQFLIRYAEIALKGGNLRYFENKLAKNIRSCFDGQATLIKQNKQFILEVPSSLIDQTKVKLSQVFGIAWFAQVHSSKSDIESIGKLAIKLAGKPKSFAVRASRIDKRLPFTSLDIAIKVGSQVQKATKSKVDLTSPELEINIIANKDTTLIYLEKISGAGGLPVGTSGKVLSLLSGGFDSIVASYFMAKRGAIVNHLHFHVFADPKKVYQSKIATIIDRLADFTLSKKLYLASYNPYQMATLGLSSDQVKHELVVFRRLMARVGEELAKKFGYQALVFGDSLGQVASQTMENIVAVDQAVDIPIFRPLIGMDKKDIINQVKLINLEEATNQPYKDCCSIVSKTPAIKADLEKIIELENKININKIIDEVVKQI